jgi:hypothetical protein
MGHALIANVQPFITAIRPELLHWPRIAVTYNDHC